MSLFEINYRDEDQDKYWELFDNLNCDKNWDSDWVKGIETRMGSKSGSILGQGLGVSRDSDQNWELELKLRLGLGLRLNQD